MYIIGYVLVDLKIVVHFKVSSCMPAVFLRLDSEENIVIFEK